MLSGTARPLVSITGCPEVGACIGPRPLTDSEDTQQGKDTARPYPGAVASNISPPSGSQVLYFPVLKGRLPPPTSQASSVCISGLLLETLSEFRGLTRIRE